MSQKPTLTDEQKASFERQFRELISQSSEQAKELWAKEGEIIWLPPPVDEPHLRPKGIEGKLHGRQADRYVTLLNQIINRTIK